MKKTIKTSIQFASLLLLATLFSQCNDIETTSPFGAGYKIDVGSEINRTITGIVIDENENPVKNVVVRLLDETTTTDDVGFFEFVDVKVMSKHVFVKVNRPGYFLGSRSISPTEGVNSVSIKLMPKVNVGVVSSNAGGTVSFDDVSISLGQDYVDKYGNSYSGNVNVSAAYIDPTAEDLNDIMPGNLRASSGTGEVLLTTFGMVGVELTDDAGNELQIADGSEAEIRMPIPASIENEAPSSIPLWHFDEEKGYWVEEGQADKIGSEYVGNVKHFSFWNCDIPVASTTSFGRILDEAGNPVGNLRLIMHPPNTRPRAGGTSSQGRYGGIMPANVEMQLKASIHLYDAISRQYRYFDIAERTIAPLSNNSPIPDIVLTDEELDVSKFSGDLVKVRGTVADCSGGPLDVGSLKTKDGRYIEITNGDFEFLAFVDQPLELTPILFEPFTYYGTTIKVTPFFQSNEIPRFTLCNPEAASYGVRTLQDLESFSASYKVDGETYAITAGVKIQKNVEYKSISIDLGYFADPVFTGQGINMYLLDYEQPRDYVLTATSNSTLDFVTDFDRVQAIQPKNIQVRVLSFGTQSGDLGEIRFSGTFREWDKSANGYVNRTLSDGLITFKMK